MFKTYMDTPAVLDFLWTYKLNNHRVISQVEGCWGKGCRLKSSIEEDEKKNWEAFDVIETTLSTKLISMLLRGIGDERGADGANDPGIDGAPFMGVVYQTS